MPDYLLVLLKISSMFCIMAVGWFARRWAYVNAAVTGVLSRLVVDIVFPCLVFTQMLRTVDAAALRTGWFVPLLGAGIILLAAFTGLLVLPWTCERARLPTAVFLAALPNWIFLPLPIAAALFGDAGVRDVLLINVGAQLTLWSLGVWTLQGAAPNWQAVKQLLRNPGLLATAGGIAVALLWPGAATLESLETLDTPVVSLPRLVAGILVQAMAMLGSLTIPLSLLITGAQLGALRTARDYRRRELTSVLGVRLILAPCLTVAAVHGLAYLGFILPEATRITCYLVAIMPVAISASIMTERFGGDNLLSARAIFLSTVLSMLSVPAFYWLISYWGL